MKKRCFVIFVFFIWGFYFNFLSIGAASDVLQEQDTRLKIVEKVLESSLVDLKKSALEVSQRNRFLLNENKNLEVSIQELEEKLKSLRGEKTPLSVAGQSPSTTEAYQKLQASSLQEQITRLSKEKDLLEQENHKSEEQNRIKQEKFGKIRKSGSAKVTEVNALRKKYDSLKTEKESSQTKGLSQEKKRLLASLKETEERIMNLKEKRKKMGNKADDSASKGTDKWQQKQSQLKQELLNLERKLSLLSENERADFNQLQNINQSRNVQLAQFNQEINYLTARKEELESTITAAEKKLEDNPLGSLSEGQSLESLEERLNSLQQENQALQAQIPGN